MHKFDIWDSKSVLSIKVHVFGVVLVAVNSMRGFMPDVRCVSIAMNIAWILLPHLRS